MSNNEQPSWEKPQFIELKVEPGEVVVSNAWSLYKSDKCALIEIDCKTKYPMLAGSIGGSDGTVGILLMASTETIKTDESRKGMITTVEFPEFVGWDVFSCDSDSYQVRVALRKKSK